MTEYKKWLGITLLLWGLGARAFADDFWKTWGDGQAELDGYSLKTPRYGAVRTGKAVLIFVTEDHSRKEAVKIEGDPAAHQAKDRISIFKLNAIRTFQTGIYDYKVMTSVFTRIDNDFKPSKISTSVQEWCGHVYHQLVWRDGRLEETLHSYFGGEGDQTRQYPVQDENIFEDGIPILIRELKGPWLQPGQTADFAGAPTLLSLRLLHKPFTWGGIHVSKSAQTEVIDSVLGKVACYRWLVGGPYTGNTTYYVEARSPRRILQWSSDLGESAVLTGTTRLPYWKLHDEGDEKYLEQLFPSKSKPARP